MAAAFGAVALVSIASVVAFAPAASAVDASTWSQVRDAVANGDDVTLTADVATDAGQGLVLPDGDPVALDLNGFDLTIVAPHAISAGATTILTIDDTGGAGILTARSSLPDVAGIGGGLNGDGGTVTINRGSVAATGGIDGAGIGGGNSGDGGAVTVNGGTVTATGGAYGAGIGGGYLGDGGTTTVNGGAVTATSVALGAGIGGGPAGNGGTTTVNGGAVTATAGAQAAGIGAGLNGDGGTVTISGGSVTATGGDLGAGIGGGSSGAVGVVAINGGTVTATGGSFAAGIGSGLNGTTGAVTIDGGTVTAVGGPDGAGIGGGLQSDGTAVAINGGFVRATGGESGAGIGAGDGGAPGTLTIGGDAVPGSHVDGGSGTDAPGADAVAAEAPAGVHHRVTSTSGTRGTAEIMFVQEVSFDTAGGTPTPDTQYVDVGATASEPAAPVREGHTFSGWFEDQAVTVYDFSQAMTFGTDIHLTAGWDVNSYTVTFDAAGGAPVPDAQSVTYGSTATEPDDPSLSGHAFAGWVDQASDPWDFSTPVEADLTLTAAYEASVYAIEAPSTATAGDTITVSGSGFDPSEQVTLELHSTPVSLGTTTADATGAFTTEVTLPAVTAAGEHSIVATGAAGQASTPITIAAAPVVDPEPADPADPADPAVPAVPAAPVDNPGESTVDDELATTGAPSMTTPLTAASALLLAGAALLAVRQRMR